MDWAGWALFGLIATSALTAVMIAAQMAGLTRLDIPLVLGTLVTADPDRARVAGFFIHLAMGQCFALGSYTRSYGSADLDAALLRLPMLGLEEPDSPAVRGTIDAIRHTLTAGGPLLYRHPPGQDGLPGAEGAFLPCSFWLVEALVLTGRRSEALVLFEELLSLATPLGLYGEEMDPATHAHLGNFPQTLTHAALIQAALALRD